MLVIRKMEAGKKCTNVCSSLGLAPATVIKCYAIAAKARSLFDKIQQKEGGNETFNASKGLLARFKQCSQIHCIKISGEAASANTEATLAFTTELKKIVQNNYCPPNLFFNVNETGLYWKKLLSRT
jgi:hypothetical protein